MSELSSNKTPTMMVETRPRVIPCRLIYRIYVTRIFNKLGMSFHRYCVPPYPENMTENGAQALGTPYDSASTKVLPTPCHDRSLPMFSPVLPPSYMLMHGRVRIIRITSLGSLCVRYTSLLLDASTEFMCEPPSNNLGIWISSLKQTYAARYIPRHLCDYECTIL